jgi:hypothetical protein
MTSNCGVQYRRISLMPANPFSFESVRPVDVGIDRSERHAEFARVQRRIRAMDELSVGVLHRHD